MDNIATNAIWASLITSVLPVEDQSIKIQIGLLGSHFITFITNKFNINIFSFIFRKKYNLSIKNRYNGIINPIYYNLEEYIISKYITDMHNLQLIPKNGDISFTSNGYEDSKELTDMYKDHSITLKIYNPDTEKDKSSKEESNNSISIYSKTAPMELLKSYTEYICKLHKPSASIITIYRIKITPYDKKDILDWESIYIKTNKNYENTIVSKYIKKELFEDIENFKKNEEWFASKGIPYKKGFLLYGPPGTGKTSIIKAISNTEKLPIFNLDLSSIKSNTDMLKLVTDINYLAKNKKYIVVIEDMDRCPLFSNSFDRHRQLQDNSLSIDCLLNVLDGIIETHGRLFFMTANNINIFDSIKDVLFRPGRIDKQLQIDYCDKDQIIKLIVNYYGKEINNLIINDIEKIDYSLLNKVTPASMIKLLQSYDNYNDLIKSFNTDTSKIESINLEINNTKKTLTTIEKLNENIKKEKSIIRKCKKQSKQYDENIERITVKNLKIKSSLEKSEEKLEKLNNKKLEKMNNKKIEKLNNKKVEKMNNKKVEKGKLYE